MNFTKTQLIKRAKEITIKLYELLDQVEELQSDMIDEADNIEPYEGKNDLTPIQEERQEWLQNNADNCESVIDSINDAISTLEDLENN